MPLFIIDNLKFIIYQNLLSNVLAGFHLSPPNHPHFTLAPIFRLPELPFRRDALRLERPGHPDPETARHPRPHNEHRRHLVGEHRHGRRILRPSPDHLRRRPHRSKVLNHDLHHRGNPLLGHACPRQERRRHLFRQVRFGLFRAARESWWQFG